MSRISREAKLVELRSKTDRDLLILVRRELDRGLTLADVATAKQSPLYAQAESAYLTCGRLLPEIAGLSRAERQELEGALRDLRAALDGLPSGQICKYAAGA